VRDTATRIPCPPLTCSALSMTISSVRLLDGVAMRKTFFLVLLNYRLGQLVIRLYTGEASKCSRRARSDGISPSFQNQWRVASF
jgi:hypothetical protein